MQVCKSINMKHTGAYNNRCFEYYCENIYYITHMLYSFSHYTYTYLRISEHGRRCMTSNTKVSRHIKVLVEADEHGGGEGEG